MQRIAVAGELKRMNRGWMQRLNYGSYSSKFFGKSADVKSCFLGITFYI